MKDKQSIGAIIIAIVLSILLMFVCTGCKTIKTVVEYRDREITKIELQHDSIYQHDSVYIAQRNDTVFRDRWHTEYAYRYINKVDSFVQIDSIPYPVEVEKVITKNSGMAKFALWWFWLCVAAAVGYSAWWVFKKFYLHK